MMKRFSISCVIILSIVLGCLTLCGFSDCQDSSSANSGTNYKSQYWLPVSYELYDGETQPYKQLNYSYDKYGFLQSVSGYGIWGYTKDHNLSLICTGQYNEETRALILSFSYEKAEGTLEYFFDENGMIDSYVMFGSSRTISPEEKNRFKQDWLWLNANGEIMERKPYESPTTVSVSTLSASKIELNLYDSTESREIFIKKTQSGNYVNFDFNVTNVYLGEIWKTAETNKDGTVTTKTYYENGDLAEKVIWKPVSPMGFWQNVCFDWDYTSGNDAPTLETIFRG